MNKLSAYKSQSVFGGWTRIEMLLAIYDRAISSIGLAKDALAADDESEYTAQFIAGQKAILAIHAGLKPDEDDVAFNVARLLHFVLQSIEAQKFDDAIKVLSDLRSGFAQIQEEANQLETSGAIPPVPHTDAFIKQV